MESRECSQCCCDFPLTDEYFHRDASKPDGFKTVCKMCRLEENKRKENDEIDDRIQKLEERGIKLLDTLVTGGSNIPHMAETYQRIMEVSAPSRAARREGSRSARLSASASR